MQFKKTLTSPIDDKLLHHSQHFLLSGSEPLLINQSVHKIRSFAKNKGFTEIHRFYSSEKPKIQDILILTQSQGLFSQGSLIEIHLQNNRLLKDLTEILIKLCENLPSHCLLLVCAEGVQLKNTTKWVKLFGKEGIHLAYTTLNNKQQKEWLNHQCQQLNLYLDDSSKTLLLAATESNLLALNQELQQLINEGIQSISFKELQKRIFDQANFNIFSIAHDALTFQAARAIRMCRSLRKDKHDAIPIIFSLANNIQLALALVKARKFSLSNKQATAGTPMWPARERQLLEIGKLGETKLKSLLKQLSTIDRQAKGQEFGDEWLSLERLIAELKP